MILERAHGYLRNGFANEAEAQDLNGADVRWDSQRAVRFCAMGAIKRATRDVLGSYGKAGASLADQIIDDCCDRDGSPIALVNDISGRAAVLRQIHRTIERRGW